MSELSDRRKLETCFYYTAREDSRICTFLRPDGVCGRDKTDFMCWPWLVRYGHIESIPAEHKKAGATKLIRKKAGGSYGRV